MTITSKPLMPVYAYLRAFPARRRRSIVVIAALALLGGGLGLASGPSAAAEPQEKFSCLPLDAAGKPLPNPNVAFICGQVDALRQDCDLSAKAGNASAMRLHCFGWTMPDVNAVNRRGRIQGQTVGE